MMRIFTAILLIILIHSSCAAQFSDSLLIKITEAVDSMPVGFTISIALIKDKKVEYLGVVKQQDTLLYLDLKDSLYEIGSLTKVFTSTLLASSVLDNKVNLSDFVNQSFSYEFKDSIQLNYLSLANHTSGMYRLPANLIPFLFTNKDNPYSEYTYAMFDEYLKGEIQLENKDSVQYSYSNLGAGLLAYALSKEYEQTFENLLKKMVFERYKMASTSFELKPSFKGLGPYGTKTENWSFDALKGAGGLVSNTHDLSKFVLGQFSADNIELALTRKETFSVSDNMSIGLGWHILEANTEGEKYWHNGGTGGFTSSIAFRNSNQTGVVILSNISALHYKARTIDKLTFEVLEVLK